MIELPLLGYQPMAETTRSCTIVCDGEIYTFRDQRVGLELEDYSFGGRSDTAVMLALNRAGGEAMPPLLSKVFAFAYYGRTAPLLLSSRDAMGVKPLHFIESRKGFAFAGRLKGVVVAGYVEGTMDVPASFQVSRLLVVRGRRSGVCRGIQNGLRRSHARDARQDRALLSLGRGALVKREEGRTVKCSRGGTARLFDPQSTAARVADDRAGCVVSVYRILDITCTETWRQFFIDMAPTLPIHHGYCNTAKQL